jgi:hypothetical protein
VDIGRKQCQKILECNIDELDKWTSGVYGEPDPSGNKYQNLDTGLGHFRRTWTAYDTSIVIDNKGFINRDEHGHSLNAEGNLVDRRDDHILSVLESLPVGTPGGECYHRFRTGSLVTYPHGPNMRIEQRQDKLYPIKYGNGEAVALSMVCRYHQLQRSTTHASANHGTTNDYGT